MFGLSRQCLTTENSGMCKLTQTNLFTSSHNTHTHIYYLMFPHFWSLWFRALDTQWRFVQSVQCVCVCIKSTIDTHKHTSHNNRYSRTSQDFQCWLLVNLTKKIINTVCLLLPLKSPVFTIFGPTHVATSRIDSDERKVQY